MIGWLIPQCPAVPSTCPFAACQAGKSTRDARSVPQVPVETSHTHRRVSSHETAKNPLGPGKRPLGAARDALVQSREQPGVHRRVRGSHRWHVVPHESLDRSHHGRRLVRGGVRGHDLELGAAIGDGSEYPGMSFRRAHVPAGRAVHAPPEGSAHVPIPGARMRAPTKEYSRACVWVRAGAWS